MKGGVEGSEVSFILLSPLVKEKKKKITAMFCLPVSFTKHFHSMALSLTHAAGQAEELSWSPFSTQEN